MFNKLVLDMFFEIEPVAKGRPKARIIKFNDYSKQDFVSIYTPTKTRKYENTIHLMALEFKRDKYPDVMWEGCPLHAKIVFYMPRPKSSTKAEKENPWHFKRPDADNLEKAFIDGITGVFFKDDAQISKSETYKVYSDFYGMNPGIRVQIKKLKNEIEFGRKIKCLFVQKQRGSMDGIKTTECRTCGAPIVWMKTQNGRNIPVDADTVHDPEAKIFDSAVHTSHFATCPDDDKWRKGEK